MGRFFVGDNNSWATLLDESIRVALASMTAADDVDWSILAGDLEWDCRETVLHIASDFVGYAGKLTSPRASGYALFDLILDGTPGPAELREVLQATGGILSSVVRTTDPTTLSWHPYGLAGPRDYAAMGIVEVLVHTEDLSRGLGFNWSPPTDLCTRVLDHLFANIHQEYEPWPTLLWATGRLSLGEHPRQETWRWVNTGT
jgi:hypothetical protein